MRRVVRGFFAAILFAGFAIGAGSAQTLPPARTFTPQPVAVLTQRYNNARTGTNIEERVFTARNVASGEFQQLYTINVQGQIYSQPLLAPNVKFDDGTTKNVLVIATMENRVYAYEVDDAIYGPAFEPKLLWAADPSNTPDLGPPLASNFIPMAYSTYGCLFGVTCWHKKEVPDSAWPLPPLGATGDEITAGGYGLYNINPSIGIVSTPVIDPDLGRIFVLSKTKGSGTIENRLIAFDLRTGRETASVVVGAGVSVPGNSRDSKDHALAFNQTKEMQRPGLLLQGGSVYLAFGSHQDTPPWHGWVFRYDENSLRMTAAWCSTPNAEGGSVWQAGSGIAADSAGNVYVMTGNGERENNVDDFDAQSGNFADMVVQLSPQLEPIGHFAPIDEPYRDATDLDLGSSGPVLVPGTKMLVGGDKEAKMFVLDTEKQLRSRQVIQGGMSTLAGHWTNYHIHGTPVFWRSSRLGLLAYLWPERDYVRAFRWDDKVGAFDCSKPKTCSTNADSATYMKALIKASECYLCMPGGIMTVSADGDHAGTAVLWASTTSPSLRSSPRSYPVEGAGSNVVRGALYAFDAENLSQLWTSERGSDRDGGYWFAKFNPPVVANGRVYLATFSNRLNIYGLRQWAKFITQTAPESAISPGSRLTLSITFLNVGTTVWKAGSYYVSDVNSNQVPVADRSYPLPSDVNPGGEVTIAVQLVAPSKPGPYDLQWRMVDNDLKWFGEASPRARFVVTSGPATAPRIR